MTQPSSPLASAAMSLKPQSAPLRMMAKLASGALLGKALGFLRELLMARVFGATVVADGFRGAGTAVLIPLTPLQNEGVPAVMIPMHRAWQAEGSESRKLTALCVGLCLIAILIMIAVEAAGATLVRLILGGMSSDGQSLALNFIRIMAFWMPASVLLNCLSAAEIATGRSRIAALRPTVLNVSIIVGIVLYVATGELSFLPLLYALSFNLLGVWSIAKMWREGMLDPAGLRLGLIKEVVLDFWRRLRPLLAQPFVELGQVWLERLVASGFVVGTVASIDYARTLTDSATLLIAQPIGLAVLYKGSTANSRETALSIAACLLAVSVPASIYLFMFAQDIVALIFQRGAFDETAAALTSGALRGIAVGLWASMLGLVLLRFLNSAGRNGRAAIILAVALALNAAINVLGSYVADGLNGSFMIGLGEAARGLALLVGAAIALDVHWSLLRLLALCIPPAAATVGLCLAVRQEWSGQLVHLGLGALACVPALLLSARILAAREAKAAWSRLRHRLTDKNV
jgi:putative peptidoglycan lipid II flippase